MPQDYSVTDPRERKSKFAAPAGSGKQIDVKRQALIFSGLFLLVFLILMALFEQGLDSGIAARHLLGKLQSAETDIGWRQVPALFLLGIGAGLFGGMLGMGGGVLKVAGMLLLFKLDIFFARAVSLTTMFFTTASAIWPYAKRGFLIWRTTWPMLPTALVGVLGGLLLGNHLRGATLTHIFGFFLLFLGLYTLAMVFGDPKERALRENFFNGQPPQHQRRLSGSIGALHGFICGLLGISGGVIAVPMQQLLLNMPVRHAIANTLMVSAVCSGLGGITLIAIGTGQGAFSLVHILFVAGCVGTGAVLGAQIGARIAVRSSAGVLRFFFVVTSFGAGLSLLI